MTRFLQWQECCHRGAAACNQSRESTPGCRDNILWCAGSTHHLSNPACITAPGELDPLRCHAADSFLPSSLPLPPETRDTSAQANLEPFCRQGMGSAACRRCLAQRLSVGRAVGAAAQASGCVAIAWMPCWASRRRFRCGTPGYLLAAGPRLRPTTPVATAGRPPQASASPLEHRPG